ncbi:hypothetical protein K9U39_05450 [Rhodoblastus acidophilus]|uniref:DUF2147 domain-containing protein n=1 Tax=Candidatus Rhodoblastus alkanivorans TaxID=2954117 RepID=A0ABS9Z7C1_9HYPH|nr:hypothetical protein [Candidatus Rhodoblastus alkanivorans]MCI4678678.1 hypothetical protein [Candidatus Rhodoblastus alkanivorans]MCI4683087.1 hypothetical protein [Candidatus Rhodoblastus alkanivorans]MDI4640398.1 hypothetical protein [Rhodoblastus acidophilus]
MKFAKWAVAIAFTAGMIGQAAAGDVAGSYARPNGDKVKVSVVGGKLYCKIVSGRQAGFEMCHGMSHVGGSIWKGSDMKHPSMPGMMTFNGTVTVSGGGLTIKGCAVGESMCDSESWKRI